MVLYKRKQVTFIRPQRLPEDTSIEVYYIPESKEWFYQYEDYLQRMDYYQRRKFVCEITGNSCLTFFDALQSEEREIKGVEKNFPEALREHILRFLQFNRITRLDQLVDKVYSVFKDDYFPGENVYIIGAIGENGSSQSEHQSNAKSRGVIREKVQYGSSDNVTTKYLALRLSDMQQAIVTGEKISRDRNHFTKWLIKTFIKLTMSRSHKVGAPWVVKNKYAKKYRIPQEFPDDLKQYALSTPVGDVLYEDNDQEPISSSADGAATISSKRKNATSSKSSKKKVSLSSIIDANDEGTSENLNLVKQESKSALNKPEARMMDPRSKFPIHHIPDKLHKEIETDDSQLSSSQYNGHQESTFSFSSIQPTRKNIVNDLEISFDIQHQKPKPEIPLLPENAYSWNKQIISDLMEDSEEENGSEEGEHLVSPESNSVKIEDPDLSEEIERLSEKSIITIQEALQVWTFLNVYGPALKLDNFTFDDFIYAMGWSFDQFQDIGRCELLDEVWCAVLGAILSNEIPNKDQERKAEANDTIFGLLINLPAQESFLKPKTAKGEFASDTDELDERGSESDNEGKALKSDEDESEVEMSSDPDVDSKAHKDKNGLKGTGMKSNGSRSKIKIEDGANDKEENEAGNENINEEGNEDDDDDDDGEEDEDTSEDDLKSDNHNAYIVMNYRNTSWTERLRRRNFKDGNWQSILLGVLSSVEYVPEFKQLIEKVYKTLAPKDSSATPSTVLNQFYSALDINTRLKVMNLLISLLVNGSVVRNYIDYCLETSANLRRSRLDNIRDYKIALEECHKNNQIIHDAIMVSSGRAPSDSSKRPRLVLDVAEMTEKEKEIAQSNPEFSSSWKKRDESLMKLEKLKKAKKEIEKKLTELDCQRVKYLGKDRFFNRYWWFENNGLPVNVSGSSDDENDDDDTERDRNSDGDGSIEKDDDKSSTYFMGRLWVQGPSKSDFEIHFNSASTNANLLDPSPKIQVGNDSSAQKYIIPNPEDFELKKMHFNNLPTEFLDWSLKSSGLIFKENTIVRLIDGGEREELVIDEFGGLMIPLRSLSPIQRKIIEEHPSVLLNGSDWRFYDKPDQILGLIQWLNPWGNRESQLRKELISVKETIINSLITRRKILNLDATPENELQVKDKIKTVENRIETLNSATTPNADEEIGNDSDILGRSKRSLRHSSAPRKKRKVLESFSDITEQGSLKELKELVNNLTNDLAAQRQASTTSRVMDWFNQKIRDESDKSLYEGGDKPKSRAGKKARK